MRSQVRVGLKTLKILSNLLNTGFSEDILFSTLEDGIMKDEKVYNHSRISNYQYKKCIFKYGKIKKRRIS